MTSPATTRRTGIYVRISDDRYEDEAGVDRQERDCRELAERLGWTVVEVYTENDTSAFKRRRVQLPDGTTALRVVRPEFRRLLGDLATGALDGLIAYDLDRVARDPRDIEDLIDVVHETGALTRSITGNVDDLSTDSGIMVARIVTATNAKSSADTARRVARKHEELAEQGKWGGGGRRCYGYNADRMTVNTAEVVIVREIADRILNGESLRAIARDLTKRGVPTAEQSVNADGQPKGWSTRSVHSVVTKPRNAALRTFRGEIVGPATWPAILDRETWENVLITLRERAEGQTNHQLKRWLTGVLSCVHCGRMLTGWSGNVGPRYVCSSEKRFAGCGKTTIEAAPTEDVVAKLILRYLARPDVITALSAATSATSVKAAREEAKADEAQLKELATLWGTKKVTTGEYLTARREIEERLKRWTNIVRQSVPGTVRTLLNAENLTTGWENLAPTGKRDVARVVFPDGIRIVPPAIRFAFDANRIQPVKRDDDQAQAGA